MGPSVKPDLLMMGSVPKLGRELEADFNLLRYWREADGDAYLAQVGGAVRAMVTYTGMRRVDAALLERLPKLEIIANTGAGYESVDVAAARRRGVTVTHNPGTNTVAVAELAFALVLDLAREVTASDRYLRDGLWASKGKLPMIRRAAGRPVGIVGLGRIGLEVAKRAVAFDMPVLYHNRAPRSDVPYTYVPSLIDLARQVDFLVIAAPGGPETKHLIDAEVIDAVGPEGFIVNVGRGSVVDETALVAALQEGRLGGAGLDVYENEPNVPAALLAMPNVVLQPQQGGNTIDSFEAIVDLTVQNLKAHFAGKPVLTPVP
jgi:lactate dehydrogenase-like 2-hydroxyacid dehydrogenase